MKKVSYLSDINILSSIFAPAHDLLIIFDPLKIVQQDSVCNFLIFYQEGELDFFIDSYPNKEVVLFNFSNQVLDLVKDRISLTFHFNTTPIQDTSSFYFINNPDGRMRWISPSDNATPAFLSLYNSTGIKAQAYKSIVKLAYKFKRQQWCSAGSFQVHSKKPLFIKRQLQEHEADSYAIFTGTNGPNRKAIIALCKNGNASHFLKIPLTSKAEKLVDNEYSFLRQFDTMTFKNVVVPSVTKFNNGISLSSIQTKNKHKKSTLNRQHLSALYELYNRSAEESSIHKLPIWDSINYNIKRSKAIVPSNDLSFQQHTRLCNLLSTVEAKTPSHQLISIGIGHGDFTPWNMYVTNDKLHLYDWEMASHKCPLLFDAFHYVFQTSILIDKVDFQQIKKRLLSLEQMPTCQAIVQEFKIDFNLTYQLYLLYTVSYYLHLYSQQQRLHEQAHWLIDSWTAALEDLVENEGLQLDRKASKMKNLS